MTGTRPLIDQIVITLRDRESQSLRDIYINVFDNSLSRKWLDSLCDVIGRDLHLEKNYCFLGFPESDRNGQYLCDRINHTIQAINASALDYKINDRFDLNVLLEPGPVGDGLPGLKLRHVFLNQLHRYFEDLQGVSGSMSPYYDQADATTRWHIRQLNLLCHEFETWALSWRKFHYAREWVRPSQLMCWLKAPRFDLDLEDYSLFGINSLYRDLGGVYVGVNKAIGKHHWEVFKDEGRDSRIDELMTTSLRAQTEAAADFDIEWGKDTRGHPWMTKELVDFRIWLVNNGFDPEDPSLTIGHPQVAQVDLDRSFGSHDIFHIWSVLAQHLDVYKISVAGKVAYYDYRCHDNDYMNLQLQALQGH